MFFFAKLFLNKFCDHTTIKVVLTRDPLLITQKYIFFSWLLDLHFSLIFLKISIPELLMNRIRSSFGFCYSCLYLGRLIILYYVVHIYLYVLFFILGNAPRYGNFDFLISKRFYSSDAISLFNSSINFVLSMLIYNPICLAICSTVTLAVSSIESPKIFKSSVNPSIFMWYWFTFIPLASSCNVLTASSKTILYIF